MLKSESIAAPGAGAISWGIERLGIPKLWDKGLLGRGVLVGHLDSGVDDKHPALQGAVVEFVRIDDDGKPVAAAAAFDSERHGTMTAGIIAARHLGGRTVGVAPEAHLASAMVFDGGDLVKRLLAGIEWAIDKKVRIISASVGVPGFWPQFVPVIRQLRKLGILPVFAAGNDGPGVTRAPANCPQCLSVGAIAQDGSVLPDSSSARMPRSDDPFVPDLVTPGDEIVTTDLDEGFRLASGTSMAAPHVSGLAALLWEAKPEATVDEIERVIFRSCVRTNSEPRDRANRGVPDALAAWESLTKTKVARTRAAG